MDFDLIPLLRYAVEQECSDVHITVGEPPMVRSNGEIRTIKHDPLTEEEVHDAIYGILTDRQISEYEQEWELDFGWRISGVGRFRTNIYNHHRGEGAAFRIIPDRIRSLDEIKAPPAVYDMARKQSGLVLVTGPSGCGKTTTQAAIVDLINRERRGHLLTIEDPIEYVHHSKNCLVTQREVESHTKSFASALQSALREDPDVILVGEMRDLDTISLALTAAETGNLVLGTLHTHSAADVAERIIDVFPSGRHNQIRSMLAGTLQGVIAQQLVPTKNRSGQIAVMEVMVATAAVRNLIREMKIAQLKSTIQTSSSDGMQTFEKALLAYYRQGLISKKEALARVDDKQQFEQWAGTADKEQESTGSESIERKGGVHEAVS